jgi:hypothetical protein
MWARARFRRSSKIVADGEIYDEICILTVRDDENCQWRANYHTRKLRNWKIEETKPTKIEKNGCSPLASLPWMWSSEKERFNANVNQLNLGGSEKRHEASWKKFRLTKRRKEEKVFAALRRSGKGSSNILLEESMWKSCGKMKILSESLENTREPRNGRSRCRGAHFRTSKAGAKTRWIVVPIDVKGTHFSVKFEAFRKKLTPKPKIGKSRSSQKVRRRSRNTAASSNGPESEIIR